MPLAESLDARLDRTLRCIEIVIAHRQHENGLTGLLARKRREVDLPTVLSGRHDAGDASGKLGHDQYALILILLDDGPE